MTEQHWTSVRLVGRGEQTFDVTARDGRFASVTPVRPASGRPQWLSPGLIDLHTHLAWTDFHHDDQLKRSSEEVEALQTGAFAATLQGGFTTARDAGGLTPEHARRLASRAPLRVLAAGNALGASDVLGVAHGQARVRALVESGVEWVKIFATGGLGAAPERVTDPVFPHEQFVAMVGAAHAAGARVFVHTWGGPTVDWCIETAVESVEHGIFLTAEQAKGLAGAGGALVPTAAIYRLLADPSGPQDPGPVFRQRAARATEFHRRAVEHALKAGVKIGAGTDFGSPALHGRNLLELDALVACGLTRELAWAAATTTAADILGEPLGRVEVGARADAVVFDTDPLAAPTFEQLKDDIVSITKAP